MVKSFKQIIKETVQKPRSPDEQAFIDQHTDNIDVKDYVTTGNDESIKKMKKDKTRRVDREDDAVVYDQAYTEESVDLEEKAESKAQAISARIALAVKRGKLPKSKLQGASKEMMKMSEKDLEDFTKEKKGAPYKVEEETLSEDPWEEIPMMERQLEFIAYAAEEIMEYLDMGIDPEEWFQNKLATAHDQIRTLHSYIEGDKRVRNAKMMGEEYSTELSEAISSGSLTLNDGSTVTISKEDAALINDMMKELNSSNQKEMQKRMMANKQGYDEIVKFAKAAQ